MKTAHDFEARIKATSWGAKLPSEVIDPLSRMAEEATFDLRTVGGTPTERLSASAKRIGEVELFYKYFEHLRRLINESLGLKAV